MGLYAHETHKKPNHGSRQQPRSVCSNNPASRKIWSCWRIPAPCYLRGYPVYAGPLAMTIGVAGWSFSSSRVPMCANIKTRSRFRF
jgi:hypothetical protein